MTQLAFRGPICVGSGANVMQCQFSFGWFTDGQSGKLQDVFNSFYINVFAEDTFNVQFFTDNSCNKLVHEIPSFGQTCDKYEVCYLDRTHAFKFHS